MAGRTVCMMVQKRRREEKVSRVTTRKMRGRRRRTRTVVPEHWSRQHGWFDAPKREEHRVMVLVEWSVETPRSPSIAARSLAGPTSRSPCRRADLEEASNQQCPISEDTQQGLGRYVEWRSRWLRHSWGCDVLVWSTMKPKIHWSWTYGV
jgi:hypothetical protein